MIVTQPARIGHCWAQTEPGIRTAAFSGDGRRLAIASRTVLSVVDAATAELAARLGQHHDDEGDTYEGVGLNHDGSRLVNTSLGGGWAYLWDVSTREAMRRLPYTLLDTSPDGAGVATRECVATREFREVVVDLPTGLEFRERADHGPVAVVAPDRRSMVVLRTDENGPEEYTLPDGRPLIADPVPATAATVSPDSRYVLIARSSGVVVQSASRTPDDALARARAHVFRPLPDADRASFAMNPMAREF